ncbi:MAG TPA: molybdate ABC transporter permease subunit [Casimicrobiaceae bacterium]|nr:molybdate ABC transporter permease subunit [Casimicrobiaceae bacterium]
MEWQALALSLKLAGCTVALLLPGALAIARVLAWKRFAARRIVEAALAMPLVLPPTVLGYYLLSAFGATSALGRAFVAVVGHPLAFSFAGLLTASLVFNLPFAIQPMQRAFEAIPADVRPAAACCGMSPWRIFAEIELPLAWPGVLSAMVLTFAHTLGEFGVVLMVGGNIPGETRTIAIAIYDRVQAFDTRSAGLMAAVLLTLSLAAIAVAYSTSRRVEPAGGG